MNPTFTVDGITKSTAKALAAREKSSDSAAKVVDADKMALLTFWLSKELRVLWPRHLLLLQEHV